MSTLDYPLTTLGPDDPPCLYNPKQVALIRSIAAKDCNEEEFNQFIYAARQLKLDPLRRQIFAYVFNKNYPMKRAMSVITGIMGYRAVAKRTGCYRADDRVPTFRRDTKLKGPNNPQGLASCTVRVFEWNHGEWHKIAGTAKWDEYVPLKEGRLDPGSMWAKSPELMLAKCAEAAALRKAWPSEFSNTYITEEIDRSKIVDLTPTEYADLGTAMAQGRRIVGPGIDIDWGDGTIEYVPMHAVFPRVMAFIRQHERGNPEKVADLRLRNQTSLRAFFKERKNEALDLREEFDAVKRRADERITSGLHSRDYEARPAY